MVDTKPTNKIMAIKALRELPVRLEPACISDNMQVTFTGKVDASLKDLKDLVENIMALQPEGDTKLKVEIGSLKAEIEKLRRYEKAYQKLRDKLYDSMDEANCITHPSKDDPKEDPSF